MATLATVVPDSLDQSGNRMDWLSFGETDPDTYGKGNRSTRPNLGDAFPLSPNTTAFCAVHSDLILDRRQFSNSPLALYPDRWPLPWLAAHC